MAEPAPFDFARPAEFVARRLVGARLLFDGVGGEIVETEAYDADDPASHSFRGPTPRNAAMFGPPGTVYVYRSHGLHWCLNIVCGARRTGEAALVRALRPAAGVERMMERRGISDPRKLCAGPGRLCKALGITIAQNGARVDAPPFSLVASPPREAVACPRVGISRATTKPWRFVLKDTLFASRRTPPAAEP